MPRARVDPLSAPEVLLPSPPRTRQGARRALQEQSPEESEYIDPELPPLQRTLRGPPQRPDATERKAPAKSKGQGFRRPTKPQPQGRIVAIQPDPEITKPLKVLRSPRKRTVSDVEDEEESGPESVDPPTGNKRSARNPPVGVFPFIYATPGAP